MTKEVEHGCCQRCQDEAEGRDPSLVFQRRMIVCPVCGDKRCARATDHRVACDAPSAPDPVRAHHLRTVGEVTVEHAAAILASGARAALHSLSGEDTDHRLMTLAAFLYHLCHGVAPERRDKMRSILNAVRDEVCGNA